MRHGILAALLGVGLGLAMPGPSQAQGDMDLEIPIYIGTVTQIDPAARTMTVDSKQIHVPTSVAGFEGLAQGTQVTVQVKRDEHGKLIATVIHMN